MNIAENEQKEKKTDEQCARELFEKLSPEGQEEIIDLIKCLLSEQQSSFVVPD